MSSARGHCNQKLYYAAIQLRGLRRAQQDEAAPEPILLEAYGQAIQGHLQDAYGWFLLELAQVSELPDSPPANLRDLLAETAIAQPLRGELVEFRNLEEDARSWLAALLAASHHGVSDSGRPGSAVNVLASSQDSAWSLEGLENWYEQLLEITERMGDSLDEW